MKYTLIKNFKIREFNFKIKVNFGTYLKHMQVSTQYFNINLTKFGQTNVKSENIFSFQVWDRVSFLQTSRNRNVITTILLLLLSLLLLLLLIIDFSFSSELIKTLHIPFYLFIEYTFF